jgi:hypothetical protein
MADYSPITAVLICPTGSRSHVPYRTVTGFLFAKHLTSYVRAAPRVDASIKTVHIGRLNKQASRLGFAYQTLIPALLYQYAQGELINLSEARKMLKP